MKKSSLILSLVIMFVSFATYSWAEGLVSNEELMNEMKALKIRVVELEEKLIQQEAKLKKQERRVKETKEAFIKYEPGEGVSIESAGLNIGAGATFVAQMAIDPNTATGDNEVTDATYSIDIEMEKEFNDWGLAFLHLEGGRGGGLDGDEITTFSAINRDAGDSTNRVEITEVWYEHYLFDKRLSLMTGKLDPTVMLDHNAIANDECSQFLSACFRNSTALEFPDDNTYGFRALATPLEWLEVEGGIFDDNADWEDVFEDIFSYAQINFKPNLLGRDGNYRGYFWFDDSKHAKWSDPATDTHVNFGFGTSCDQKIVDYLTWFGRFGWEDPDVSTVEWAWSTGFQLDGTPWGRENDYLGCAIGMDIPGDDYGDAGNPDDPEGHVEAYYNFHVNDCLALSPIYQLVWDPNGADSDPINTIGVRGQVDF